MPNHDRTRRHGPLIARAIEDWDSRLAAIRDQPTFVADVIADQRAHNLVLGAGDPEVAKTGAPLMRVARPFLLDDASLAHDQRVISAISQALVAAAEAVTRDPILAASHVPDWSTAGPVAALSAADPGYPEEIVIGRFDGARTPAGLQILEFNGGLPGGMMPASAGAEVMAAFPFFPEFAAAFGAKGFDLWGAALAGVVRTWHEFGGSGGPVVALVVPRELMRLVGPTADALIARGPSHGIELFVVDPDELVRSRGALQAHGRRIDVVLRGFYTPMIAWLGDRLTALIESVLAGEVCMVSSVRSARYGNKSLFALVTDGAVELDLDPSERELAAAHMPWTRLLRPGSTTTADGSVAQLTEYLTADRERLVVKPAGGFGGANVTLGWECSPEEWESAVTTALNDGGFVAQQRIDLETVEFPELSPGFPRQTYSADFNPIVVYRDVVGYLVRFTETGGITNISGGKGSLAPCFVLSDERG